MSTFQDVERNRTLSVEVSRRTALRLGGGALLATGILAEHGSVTAQGSTPQPAGTPVPFDGKAFVGMTDRPDLFVAVVIGADEARGYLCDGTSLVAWCTGPAGTDPLSLVSEDGTQMTVVPAGANLEGSATLAAGETVAFTATPATGIAGLYEVVVDGRRITGAAAGDLRLEGVVAGTLPDGTLLLAGAVALPAGGLLPLAVFATPDATGVQHWIVLDDGRVTGGPRKGSGSGFIDPTSDLAVPRSQPFIDPTTDN